MIGVFHPGNSARGGAMTKKDNKLKEEAFRLGKQAAAVRFALKWAGKGKAGAPKEALSDDRRTELEARLDELVSRRGEILAQIGPVDGGAESA